MKNTNPKNIFRVFLIGTIMCVLLLINTNDVLADTHQSTWARCEHRIDSNRTCGDCRGEKLRGTGNVYWCCNERH